MPKIKLRAGLPVGDANGLTHHAPRIVESPKAYRVAIVVLKGKQNVDDFDDLDVTTILRMLRIELVTDKGDAEVLQRLMMRATEQRTGKAMLPFESEQDLESSFTEYMNLAADKEREDGDES